MWQRFQRWLRDIPTLEPFAQRRAIIVQVMALATIIIGLSSAVVPFTVDMPLMGRIINTSLVGLLGLGGVLALYFTRKGRLLLAVMTMTLSMTVTITGTLFSGGSEFSGVSLFAAAFPITLAGLLGGRRELIVTIIAATSGVVAMIVLERMGSPLIGFAKPSSDAGMATLISFVLISIILGLLLDRTNVALRDTVETLREREHALTVLSSELEAKVQTRTTDLQRAFRDIEAKAAEQAELLRLTEVQRETIRGLSVPVLPVSRNTLVLPLIGDLDEQRIVAMREQALISIERSGAKYLLLDVTGVSVIDTSIARDLLTLVQSARMLGSDIVLIGIRPEVAQTIVGLGIELSGVRTFVDLQSALLKLR